MKKSKPAEAIRDNFLPGKISAEGFLGRDKRTPQEIIDADRAETERIGLNLDAAAAKLQRLMREGKKGLGSKVTVDRTFTVVAEEARGALPCPFEDFRAAKCTAVITRLASGRALVVSDLSIHLLATHHFLQGKGSAFRLEPGELKEVLGL